MIHVAHALDALRGVTDRGFTFVNGKGPGEDLALSFDEVRAEAIRRASHLRALGLSRGDRLALVLPDGPDFVPTFLAALWMGAVPVPLYPPLSLGKLDAFMEALVTILNVAKPRMLVTDERVGKVLWSAVGQVASIEKVVQADELRARAAASTASMDERPVQQADGDLAFLQFTSGSTSTPKGVMVTQGSLAANCHAIVYQGLEARPERDKGVSWLPLYHDMGLIGFVLAPLINGIPVVFIPTLSFIKNATLWLETISKHKGTISFAPNFAYALATKRAKPEQLARWDLSQMRVFGCGAEPINPEVMRAFLAAMAPAGLKPESLVPSYGMAEATLAISFVPLADKLKTDRIDASAYHGEHRATPTEDATRQALEVVCCGRTFPDHEVAVFDERGGRLPERRVGEIAFRGPSVAAGYFESPETSREAGLGPGGDGWLRTGDLGYLANGEVYISGRLKDLIILNGRNYYPQRIEWLVDEIPGVRRGSAVVFSRPGKASEELVVAAETRAEDQAALTETIRTRINEEFQLAVADVALLPPGALPKTSSGKLQRRKTREQYLNGTLGKEGVRTLGEMGNRLRIARHLALSLLGRAQHGARTLWRRVSP